MSDIPVPELRRRLETISRAAGRLRQHLPDLHTLGWDAPSGDGEPDRGQFESRTPRSGHPHARHLYSRIDTQTAGIEADLIGLERAMVALFYVGSTSPEPSRGSMISRADFDDQLTRQQRRPDTPIRLVEQPPHPGAKR